MSDQTPWLSAPLGGQPEPATDRNDVDDVGDEEFHARLGGVPIERLSPLRGESRIDQLPPPPYPAEPPVAGAGVDPGFADPWAQPNQSSNGWVADGAEPEPVSADDLRAQLTGEPVAASGWDDLDAATREATTRDAAHAAHAGDSSDANDTARDDVWADGAEAATWDPPVAAAAASWDPPAAGEDATATGADALDDLFEDLTGADSAELTGEPDPDPTDADQGDAPTATTEEPLPEPTAEDLAPPVEPDADPGEALDAPAPAHTAEGDLGLEDLFGDDDLDDTPATAPIAPAAAPAAAKKWAPGVDRYEDPQIVYAAGRITAQASAIPGITNVTREFKLTRDPQLDAEQRRALEAVLEKHMHAIDVQISPGDYDAVVDLVYDELLGLGPLGAAWRADEVTEILVDGWGKVIVEVGGELLGTDMRFRDADQAASIARDLAQKVSDRQLSPSTPLVTAKLDRARVNFAYGPVVPELGLAISIRKFNAQLSMAGLLSVGALTPGMRDLLWAVVKTRGTVLVSGATGVGKTTLLSAAAEAIPYNERIITIEDAREISLGDRLSWVPMQTKEKASGDDTSLIEQVDLLHNSLRQRPDRLIVGEIRDGRTASVMLEAANTGHEGTMTTLHANSASDALNSRLVRAIRRHEDSPAEVIREEVAEAFDLVLHGIRRNGRRFVAEICEVSPRYVRGGRIEPRVLWRGHVDPGGEVSFEHVAGLDPEGRNAERLIEAGMDPATFDPA